MLKGQENRSDYREYELREVNLILPNLVSLVDLKKTLHIQTYVLGSSDQSGPS